MPFAPGRIDRRNGAQERPPIFPRKVDVFYVDTHRSPHRCRRAGGGGGPLLPAAEAAPEQQFRDRLQAYAGHFWLMFDGETLISFVDGMVTDQPDLTDDLYENAALHSETGAWQMIFGVVTRPEYRKHGLAAQLLNRAIADARQQGRKGLVLTCKDKLVHYYAKFGFVNEGVSQSTHGNVAWNQMRLTF